MGIDSSLSGLPNIMGSTTSRQRTIGPREKLRIHNEWFVPLTVLVVPLNELADALADVAAQLVADEPGGLRNIGVGVFGVAIAGLGVFDVERGIDLIADDLCECGNVDIVGQADVHRFAVGTVVGQEAVVGLNDIGDIRYCEK